ncbi:MAG TPA: ATP-binding protein [Acidimicrobiales bacterium]|nr:ATP-binding protein [Acidimicrobiales bacterium]
MGDGTTTRYDETIRLPCEPRSVRLARCFVDAVLARLGWGDLDRELAQLVTSELVANAVLYAPGSLAIRCAVDGVARIDVVDDHVDAAVRSVPRGPDEIGGLGLQLIGQVAREWGVERGPRSKTVWCVVEPRRAPAPRRPTRLADCGGG